MKNLDPKALLSFMSASDANLAIFAAKVIKGITGNPSFPNAQNIAKELVPALGE